MSEEQEQKNEEIGSETDRPAEPVGQSAPAEAPSEPTESAEEQLAQLKDLLLRKAAEFENYKRRTESELSNVIRMANEGLIVSILPVLDDLERSLKAARSSSGENPLFKGVELIHQKLMKVLESQGVTPLETVGKPFDVHFHDALMQVPKDDVPHHTILQEVDRGYSMNGKVIRHARVVVSTAPDEPAVGERESGDSSANGEKGS